MIIDKEEHRAVLLMAIKNIPISGPAGEPELLRHVMMVHEIVGLIEAATVGAVASDTIYNDVQPG